MHWPALRRINALDSHLRHVLGIPIQRDRDVRMRVIHFVEEGGSRREAAEQLEVNVSSAIRWVQRFRGNGTSKPMPRGGVLRHWSSTRGRSSPPSASNRTSR
jgi:hypothetical protein